MRTVAYMILLAVFLSLLLIPLVEVFFFFRDDMLLSAAITNSFRVARNLSVSVGDADSPGAGNLNAVLEPSEFLETFAETLRIAIGAEDNYPPDKINDVYVIEYYGSIYGNDRSMVTLIFTETSDEDSPYNDISISIEADMAYKFKTGLVDRIADTLNLRLQPPKKTFNLQIAN